MEILGKIFKNWKFFILITKVCPIFFVLIGVVQLICTSTLEAQSIDEATARLQTLHSHLHLIHGNLTEEYPEQLMAAMYLSKSAKVLELGGGCWQK